MEYTNDVWHGPIGPCALFFSLSLPLCAFAPLRSSAYESIFVLVQTLTDSSA
jgi:hypothetical protein